VGRLIAGLLTAALMAGCGGRGEDAVGPQAGVGGVGQGAGSGAPLAFGRGDEGGTSLTAGQGDGSGASLTAGHGAGGSGASLTAGHGAAGSGAPLTAAHGAAGVASGGAGALPVEVTASLQELMRDEVDASADAIWDAVGTTTTRDGIVEKRPRSDEDWRALRRHAVVLLEATNLLVIPGRRVAAKEFPSDGPGVFSSQEIQTELGRRRQEFDGFALGLRATGRRVLAAIDSRDVDALLKEGAVMDNACEACHRSFWYPHEIVPALPSEPPQL
jgi:hypothetical protein